MHPNKTEMTGTNDTMGAVRLGKRQRQLLGKEEAGCRRSFCLLTAYANGRPLSDFFPFFPAHFARPLQNGVQ